jgi:hypothetical protein
VSNITTSSLLSPLAISDWNYNIQDAAEKLAIVRTGFFFSESIGWGFRGVLAQQWRSPSRHGVQKVLSFVAYFKILFLQLCKYSV